MLALAGLALVAAVAMTFLVTERVPHLEDEIAYLFQARTYARGKLWAPPPPLKRVFFTPFVLTIHDKQVGKYPFGWPLMLALGERVGAGWLVNPILGAVTVILTYALGRDLYNRRTGTIAGLLALTSPFFLIQSSTYMSHAAACLWATLLAWALLRVDVARDAGRRRQGWAALAGFSVGMLALTRPLTALGIGVPFVVWLGIRALRRPRDLWSMAQTYWPLALLALTMIALQPLYLYVVTGNPSTNLYTFVWDYDRIGFGPGIGPHTGHTLRQGLLTAAQGLKLWSSELFGWPYMSWIPLLLGLVAGFRGAAQGRQVWPILFLAPFLSLVTVHIAYWVGAQVYGPRYYYEAHAGLCILAALGLQEGIRVAKCLWTWLRKHAQAGLPTPLGNRCACHSNIWLTSGLLIGLIAVNVSLYLPDRLSDWHGMYNITAEPVVQLERLRQSDSVVVFVRGEHWIDYAPFFAMNSPWLDSSTVAAHDLGLNYVHAVMSLYPEREVWFYNNGLFSKEPLTYE